MTFTFLSLSQVFNSSKPWSIPDESSTQPSLWGATWLPCGALPTQAALEEMAWSVCLSPSRPRTPLGDPDSPAFGVATCSISFSDPPASSICLDLFSCTTPWTVAHQAPLSVGFPRTEYWSGLLLSSPGDLPHPGIKPTSLAWQADALPLHQQGSFVLNPQSNKTEAARVQPYSHSGPDASLPEAPLQRAWPVHSNALSLFRAMPQRWTRPLTTASGASGGEDPPPRLHRWEESFRGQPRECGGADLQTSGCRSGQKASPSESPRGQDTFFNQFLLLLPGGGMTLVLPMWSCLPASSAESPRRPAFRTPH